MSNASRHLAGLLLAASAVLAAPAGAAIVVDGTLDGDYGAPGSVQTTQTQFGNSSLGQTGAANGSELDAGYAVFDGHALRLFLAGNLESNFNKLEIFIDCLPGGQNKLRGDNPNVDFNGLNRMGDDGSGNGLIFDAGFEPDFWIGVTGGNNPYELHANYAVLLTAGGGTGAYLGTTGAASGGVLSGGSNPHGIKVTIHNGNTGGVDAGCAAASGAGVTTGVELEIPNAAIGNTSAKVIRVSAFVNGGGHDFVSNQVLGPLPVGTCNLGEPRLVNFNAHAGNQHFTATSTVPAASPWLLLALTGALLGAGGYVLLRRAHA